MLGAFYHLGGKGEVWCSNRGAVLRYSNDYWIFVAVEMNEMDGTAGVGESERQCLPGSTVLTAHD